MVWEVKHDQESVSVVLKASIVQEKKLKLSPVSLEHVMVVQVKFKFLFFFTVI